MMAVPLRQRRRTILLRLQQLMATASLQPLLQVDHQQLTPLHQTRDLDMKQ